ncbi:hypothetical protein ACQ4PT_001918 [Festuca glaucescens]
MAALFNYGALILCGKVGEDPFVTWMSVAGAIVQAIYLTVFLKCSTPAHRRWWLVCCVPPAIAYVVLLCFYCAGRTAHFDVVCAVSGVVQAFSPLLNAHTIYQTMSMEGMPPWPLPLASLLNSAIWTRYAFAGTEVLTSMAAPHITTLVTATIQLLLHAFCYAVQWPELSDLGE